MARGPGFAAVAAQGLHRAAVTRGLAAGPPKDLRGGQGITACLQGGGRQGCRRLGRDQQRVS